MDQIDKRKLEQIRAMDDEAIKRIIASVPNEKPSWSKPMAGQARIEGIGNVSINLLRNVLGSR
jgi:hypothetical protein